MASGAAVIISHSERPASRICRDAGHRIPALRNLRPSTMLAVGDDELSPLEKLVIAITMSSRHASRVDQHLEVRRRATAADEVISNSATRLSATPRRPRRLPHQRVASIRKRIFALDATISIQMPIHGGGAKSSWRRQPGRHSRDRRLISNSRSAVRARHEQGESSSPLNGTRPVWQSPPRGSHRSRDAARSSLGVRSAARYDQKCAGMASSSTSAHRSRRPSNTTLAHAEPSPSPLTEKSACCRSAPRSAACGLGASSSITCAHYFA